MRNLILLSLAVALAAPAVAQVQPSWTRPQPLERVSRIPAARDIPYPGTLTIHVDATDTARAIYRVRETIPVQGPGPKDLLYH